VEYGTLGNDADCKRSNPDRKKELKKMKSGFLQKQTSRRDISRDSVIRAGNDFLGHLSLATLSGSSLELGVSGRVTHLGGAIAWLLRRYLSVMIDQDLSPVEWRRLSIE